MINSLYNRFEFLFLSEIDNLIDQISFYPFGNFILDNEFGKDKNLSREDIKAQTRIQFYASFFDYDKDIQANILISPKTYNYLFDFEGCDTIKSLDGCFKLILQKQTEEHCFKIVTKTGIISKKHIYID